MKKIIVALTLFASASVFANSPQESSVWQDVQANAISQLRDIVSKGGIKKRSLLLNTESLRARLTPFTGLASASGLAKLTKQLPKSIEIELPLANNEFIRVKAYESPILSQEMAEAHPEIKTWRVVGVDDPSVTGRIDFTQNGFHGLLTLADGDTVYIDPENEQGGNQYRVFSKKENASQFHKGFNCQVHHDHAVHAKAHPLDFAPRPLAAIPALDLKTYRLAVAGTGEYTASQGGTKASAYASMVTTINRVNEIYQRDIGIKLELVSGENLIYTNPATDPYTNQDASALVFENIENMDTNFGVDNFDIGHVFANGDIGGLAFVGVACLNQANVSATRTVNAIKAGGATGTSNPSGEIFSMEYVAHEIGHQLGASHTFNSSLNGCSGENRSASTAVEPGSGSTIMSYAGLCGNDDLQFNSEAMFHFASIDQINDYTRNDIGNTCGVNTATGNQNPEANAGIDIRIPSNTPFLLDGSATGGTTYSWDQIDVGTSSAVGVDTGNNAIIRSYLPSLNEDRYIPRLSDLFAGSTTIGETLPQTTRSLNFTYVVRDGLGGIGTDEKQISVTNTGTVFSVTSQSNDDTLQTGQIIQVDWNKANTDSDPISCANVDVLLLRENGVKNMLLAATDNDGSQSLVIPSSTPAMTDARIMVGCSDNSFFNISSGKIAVQNAVDNTPPVLTILGMNPIQIELDDSYIDAGATASDNFDANVTVTVTGLSAVNTSVAGEYKITYTATDIAGNTVSEERTIIVEDSSSDATNGSSSGGGGGSFGYLLMPLMILLGLRRPKPVRVKTK